MLLYKAARLSYTYGPCYSVSSEKTLLMDKLDIRILDALQRDFPLCERPFKVIGERLGYSERQVWDRVQALMHSGVIRRLGLSLDSRKLGFASTLAAIRVESARVSQAAHIINHYPEVTHCYLRKDAFNIWFTLIAANPGRIQEILSAIRTSLGLDAACLLNLPVERLFKLDARFHADSPTDPPDPA